MEEPPRPESWSLPVRFVLALFLIAASAIHFLEVPAHFEEDAIYGWFFLGTGLAQSAAAIALTIRPSRRLLLITVAGSLAIVAVWAITRTVGIPVGAQAGIIEPVGRPDLVATALELGTAAIGIWVLKLQRQPHVPALAVPIGLVFGVAAVVLATTGTREACEHFDPQYGPLAAVDGHSILPEGTAESSLPVGTQKTLLAGFIVNCGSQYLKIKSVSVLTDAGDAVRIEGLKVLPAHHRDDESKSHHPDWETSVAVAPTDETPEMAVFVRARGISQGMYYLNGLRIVYLYRGAVRSQVFATNLVVRVEGQS